MDYLESKIQNYTKWCIVEKRYFSKEQNDFHFMYILKKLMLILFLRITKKNGQYLV